MDKIAEGFERNRNLEFRQFYLLQKNQLEKVDRNYIEFLMLVILAMINSVYQTLILKI